MNVIIVNRSIYESPILRIYILTVITGNLIYEKPFFSNFSIEYTHILIINISFKLILICYCFLLIFRMDSSTLVPRIVLSLEIYEIDQGA